VEALPLAGRAKVQAPGGGANDAVGAMLGKAACDGIGPDSG
jgi:hypothetical protein